VFASCDPAWLDQGSSWWAKANRAKEHIDSLHRLTSEFRALSPYSLTPERTEKPGRLAHRLRFSQPVPVVISTTVGDVLHNLRAALESLAFEVARRSQGGSLTPAQEKVSTFPICESPDAFDAFFNGKKGRLYDSRSRAALRSVQPFVNLEDAHRFGVVQDRSFEDEVRWSQLHRLDTLWNIDKHRRSAADRRRVPGCSHPLDMEPSTPPFPASCHLRPSPRTRRPPIGRTNVEGPVAERLVGHRPSRLLRQALLAGPDRFTTGQRAPWTSPQRRRALADRHLVSQVSHEVSHA
jgi:hypothetical protein